MGSTGWYRDFLVNEAGTWRVKKRVIVQDARAAKADTGSGPAADYGRIWARLLRRP